MKGKKATARMKPLPLLDMFNNNNHTFTPKKVTETKFSLKVSGVVFFPADFLKSPGEYPLINLSTINIHWCSEKVEDAAGATVSKKADFLLEGEK